MNRELGDSAEDLEKEVLDHDEVRGHELDVRTQQDSTVSSSMDTWNCQWQPTIKNQCGFPAELISHMVICDISKTDINAWQKKERRHFSDDLST